jgi:hypothetical protein
MMRILELRGYRIVAEDEFNWAMEPKKYESGVTQEPIILPKRGHLLSVDIMMDTLIKTKTDLQMYFALKSQVIRDEDIPSHQSEDDIQIQ